MPEPLKKFTSIETKETLELDEALVTKILLDWFWDHYGGEGHTDVELSCRQDMFDAATFTRITHERHES